MKKIVVVVLFLSLVKPMQAQHIYPDWAYIKSFGSDVGSLGKAIKSPTDKLISTTLLIGATESFLFSNDLFIKNQFQNHTTLTTTAITKYVEPLGRGSTALGGSALLYAGGYLFKNIPLQKAGLLGFKSVVMSAALVTLIKYTVQRQRPNTTSNPYNIHGIWNTHQYVSFPSGHSSDAFALATAVCSQIKNKYWHIPIYAAAAAVAVSRVHDNKHWASDVVMGSCIGYFTTRFIIRQTHFNVVN